MGLIFLWFFVLTVLLSAFCWRLEWFTHIDVAIRAMAAGAAATIAALSQKMGGKYIPPIFEVIIPAFLQG